MTSAGAASVTQLRSSAAELFGGPLVFFPVRHHSPACSWHLRQLIRQKRPTHVLIEGPSAFNGFVNLLAHPGTQPPVALYSFCGEDTDDGRQRRGAYYPFCDYSPEWIALREAREIGAEVRFIDLDFPQQICVDHSSRLAGRVATLLADKHFERSAYLRRLAVDQGCRGHDELWDRLFESWGPRSETGEFVAQVASYCDLSRRDVSDAEHEHDGTTAREAEMAWHIHRCIDDESAKRVIVVTGGYHTVVLPTLVAARVKRPEIAVSRIHDVGTVLIRYSFDRLDRLRGYGAGMPSPAFYQLSWERLSQPPSDEPELALQIMSDIAERVRQQRREEALNATTLIAAYEQVQRLARLRNNPVPTRDDVLDAIVSCFVKGAVDAEGRAIVKLAVDTLTGSLVGQVPPEAGQPPIVMDFNAQAAKLRLKVADSDVRKLTLDIFRERRDRDISRFLHTLALLDVPFASRLAGPDLTGLKSGRRLQEHWEYSWSPHTESGLIDAASYGSTVAEAASSKFLEALRKVSEEEGSRSAAAAVEWLSRACLLGLHSMTARILGWLRTCVREDPSLPSCTKGLGGLVLLWESREPLGASGLETVPELARACYQRALYLVGDAHSCPDVEAASHAEALIDVRASLAGACADWFDAEPFWNAVLELATTQPCQPTVSGAAAGVLYSAGRWTDEDLSRCLRGRLLGLGSRAIAAYFRGLVPACREVLWHSTTMLQSLRDMIESSTESEFIALLPELRLALAALTPRETDQLAERVAQALGVTSIGSTVTYGVSEEEVRRNLDLAQRMREVLERDGLGEWMTGAPHGA